MTPSSEGGWRRLCENCHIWRMRGQVVRTAHRIGSGVQSSLPRRYILPSVSLPRKILDAVTPLNLKHLADNGQNLRGRFSASWSKLRPDTLLDWVTAALGMFKPSTLPGGSNHSSSMCLTRRISLKGWYPAVEPPASTHTLAAFALSL